MYYALAKSSFSIPKSNDTESSFTKDKEYECIKRSNENFVIKDNEGSAIELEAHYALNEFFITGD